MDKIKRRYNWKARQVVQTEIDNTVAKKISIDLKSFQEDPKALQGEQYDDCNILVLPSEKRKTKKKKDKQAVTTKILSKKERKRLEKIVDTKKKKENRSSLLAALAQVQVAPELVQQLTSIATVQTRGLKRQRTHTQLENIVRNDVSDISGSGDQSCKRAKINSIAGSRKLRKKYFPAPELKNINSDDPNVLGFESSSDSSDETSDIEDEIGSEADSIGEDNKEGEATPQEPEEVIKVNGNTAISEPVIEQQVSPVVDPKDHEPAVFIHVNRPPAIQAARLKLPVLAEEQVIMETIKENSVVVLAGETGSGKTTQVPQFLYEAGYARNGKLIGVTEPRRVAALSMSQRVAEEMGLSQQEVSYLIRFEGSASENTRILFMTDGVLLREARHDLLLSRYSAIIVDEAHERSVFTDILIGLLSRIVNLRAKRGDPLKLIIMSATLRLADFTENPRLFKNSPKVINVETRQYPVTVHFSKRTVSDYVGEAFRKTCKVHTQLPDGGILVFVTGQQEVKSLVRRLRNSFPYIENYTEEATEEYNREGNRKHKVKAPRLPVIDLNAYPLRAIDNDDDAGSADSDLECDDENDSVNVTGSCQPLWVLPLYSLLPSHEQARVFKSPPPGTRLCVVATNVAETSLTIPGVKYVIDCGRTKTRHYDKLTGVSAFKVDWTSKASADQRAGRAGRVGPGHCYRLYSSAVFNDLLPQFAEPDIKRRSVDDLVLQMKSMGIHKVVNFPFPSAPDLLQLRAAERRLTLLGALEPLTAPSGLECQQEEQFTGRLTALGKSMSSFPVAPRYGKMLALSAQHEGLMPHAVSLVAALSVPELLLDPGGVSKACGLRGQSLLLGDPSVLLRVMCGAERAAQKGEEKLQEFCERRKLRLKGVIEVRKLRAQLTSEINLGHPEQGLCLDPKLPAPTEVQARLLRQVLLAGMVDQVAIKVAPEEINDPQERLKWKHAYRCAELEDPVFMHSSCILRKSKPQWVIYQEVFETSKMYMRGVTAIEPEWLPVYSPSLCNLSPPLLDPPPRVEPTTFKLLCSVTGTFGRAGWELPRLEIEFPKGADRYKFFAQQFLEGNIFTCLQKYRHLLLFSPATILKKWSLIVERTAGFLNSLANENIDSKFRLQEVWKSNPQFLLSAYQQWLPESSHNQIAQIWPPLDKTTERREN